MERLLRHIVNSDLRQYIIERVNEPLAKAIILLAGRYPEPTHDNVVHPNSHILLDIRDEFRKCWYLNSRNILFEALFRVVIVKYEHSPPWRNVLDWALMMLMKSQWKQFNPNRQMSYWKGGK